MELSPEVVAGGLRTFLGRAGLNLPAAPAPSVAERPDGLLRRIPAFCAGCPHATSTKLPDGSFASAGIGCHFMALDDGPHTRTFTQMGGEGAPFVGLSSFTDMQAHVRQSRRRHLSALRQPGDPPGGRRRTPASPTSCCSTTPSR